MDPHLAVFKAVADKRSFSQAAKSLHISQPAISLQIQSLEENLGARLFDRNNKRVVLTQAGKTFYKFATQIIELYDQAQKEIAELTGLVKGKIKIGASLTIGEYVLPKIAGYFVKDHPEVNITINIANTEEITRHLLANTLDIGLVEGPIKHSDLILEKFMDDELVVIVPFDHPWAKKDFISMDSLLSQPFVLREAGSGTRQIMEEKLMECSVDYEDLQIAMELGSTQAIKEAVEVGLGVSIISKWAIKKDLKFNNLGMTRIENCTFNRNFYLVYNKHHFLTQATETLIKLLKSNELTSILEAKL
ncbi:selenium metabolism-associated LysR family transcriptional regulator [Desulfitibacter alkalitolerans]|uniref:selenium metabolism-associated LysR family transcriptional regulator n=1 Tax=Desulfitibacter alkalitolerans TaxID=264641 RepID=UPI0004822000|nr:selenium metabolism-associated LysR family transcriptional regulator [Desulfitibacter alkalitolerans]